MPEPAPSVTPVPGVFARAWGIITAPRAIFERVIPQPRIAGMMFLVALVMGLSQGLPQFTERGQQAAVDMQVQSREKMMGRPVSDAEYDQISRFAKYGGYAATVSSLIFVPIAFGIFAAIFWAFFNVALGGTATYRQVMSVIVHSGVIGALGAALGAPVQYARGTMSYSGPFNLGVLLPMLNEGSFLASFLGFISVFSIWGTIVTAIGLSVLYKRKARNIAIGLFILYGLFAAAGAAFMTR